MGPCVVWIMPKSRERAKTTAANANVGSLVVGAAPWLSKIPFQTNVLRVVPQSETLYVTSAP